MSACVHLPIFLADADSPRRCAGSERRGELHSSSCSRTTTIHARLEPIDVPNEAPRHRRRHPLPLRPLRARPDDHASRRVSAKFAVMRLPFPPGLIERVSRVGSARQSSRSSPSTPSWVCQLLRLCTSCAYFAVHPTLTRLRLVAKHSQAPLPLRPPPLRKIYPMTRKTKAIPRECLGHLLSFCIVFLKANTIVQGYKNRCNLPSMLNQPQTHPETWAS